MLLIQQKKKKKNTKRITHKETAFTADASVVFDHDDFYLLEFLFRVSRHESCDT